MTTNLIKERPILFSGAMVRALLAGTKTQTRRAVKWPLKANSTVEYGENAIDYGRKHHADPTADILRLCPYGQPGDRLWVREAWRVNSFLNKTAPSAFGHPKPIIAYDATDGERTQYGRLRAGMHMPRWASRLLLEITAVRCERLQDIGGRDAFAEGMESYYTEKHVAKHGMRPVGIIDDCCMIRTYETIWKEINGPDSWAANPWVWVVEFMVIDGKEATNG